MKHLNCYILVFTVLIAFFVRIPNISDKELSHDELITIGIANGLKREVVLSETFTNKDILVYNTVESVKIGTIADNGNSFAYNIVLHYWLKLFGNSNLSARLLSILFGILLIPLIYFFSNSLFKNKTASLIIAFLTSIHPLLVDHAQVSRAYSMGVFFCLLSTFLLYRIVSEEKRNIFEYISYALCVVISLMTHYLTLSVFISHALIFILFIRNKKVWIKGIATCVLAVFLFSIWLWVGGLAGFEVMKDQSNTIGAHAINSDFTQNAYWLPATPVNIMSGWIQIWLPILGNCFQNFGLRLREISFFLLIPFALLAFLYFKTKDNKQEKTIFFSFVVFMIIQTFFTTFLAINSGHCVSFEPFYSIFIVPYAMIIMGYAMLILYKRMKNKIIPISFSISIGIIMIISIIPTHSSARARHFNYNNNIFCTNAKKIKQDYKQGDTVLMQSLFQAKKINMFLPKNNVYFQKIDTTLKSMYLIKGK